MKTALVAGLLWVAMLLAPAIVLVLLYVTPPNWMDSPLAHTLPLLPSLLGSNPLAAVKLFAAQPPLVLAYVETGSGLRVWEVYLYLLPMLLTLGAALYAARQWPRLAGAKSVGLCLGGLVSLAVALNTIRVAACCTAPAWALDVWLRGLALTPAPGGVDWGSVYLRVEPWILPLQLTLAGLGIAFLVIAGRRQG